MNLLSLKITPFFNWCEIIIKKYGIFVKKFNKIIFCFFKNPAALNHVRQGQRIQSEQAQDEINKGGNVALNQR